VVSDEGVVLSAARYIDAVSNHLEVPLGLGSRHVAAASVSSRTDAVSVAVSESSTVRMFVDGELVAEIVPELWILGGMVLTLMVRGWVAKPKGPLCKPATSAL
jgi:diadenylate cyclase